MGSFLSNLFIDPTTLPQDGFGFVQLLFLLITYAYVLYTSSNMISDGSELLLLIPALAGIVGSVVLPVLGAVPDGAIVLFSGMGPLKEAQEQLSVGVGALAGSTIMLLTIPWILSLVAGRVNIENGSATYKKPRGAAPGWSKLSPPGNKSIFGTGVESKESVAFNGKIMIATCISFVVIQGPAFGLGCSETKNDASCNYEGEKYWALVGFILCIVAFIGYLYYQVIASNSEAAQDKIDATRQKAIDESLISLSGAFAAELNSIDENTPLTGSQQDKRMKNLLKTFFHRYDFNGDGTIDKAELSRLMDDLNEKLTPDQLTDLLHELDSDNNGIIDFDEFCDGMMRHVTRAATGESGSINSAQYRGTVGGQADEEKGGAVNGDDDDDEDSDSDGEEEMPEEFQHLSPAEQQRRVLMRSFYLMFLGTFIVLVFSDPMVDVLSELGTRTGIPAFYVAFVLAPLASNASELLASYNYALKKTKKSITISLSALIGAACMNNTFCLGIFLALVFFRGLAWEFSAETISILFVQIVMLGFSLKKTQRLLDGILVFTLYPISLVLVIVLEKVGLN